MRSGEFKGRLMGAALCVALSSSALGAVISMTNSTSVFSGRAGGVNSAINLDGTNGGGSITSFDLTGGNAIVVLFASEGAMDFNATFAGEAMTVVNSYDGTRFVSGIAYLINPTASTGDVVVTSNHASSGRLSFAYTALSLSNVATPAADSATRTNNGNLAYTTTDDGGYLVASALNNSFNGSTLPSTTGNADMNLGQSNYDGNFSALLAHGDVATAGAYSDNFTGSLTGASVVAFNSIPEPSSLAFLMAGMVAMIAFRRRS